MATPANGYRTADGKKVPGVTTVLGRYKESGGLIRWAYKTGCEHGELRALGKQAPRDLYDVTKEHAEAGTIGHDMIEADILGKPYVLPSDQQSDEMELRIKRAKNSFAQYLDWKGNTKIEIIATEQGMVSERHRYGGTLDAIGRDSEGRIVLLDWKTSNAIYGDYLYQLAAYALLLEENKPEWTPKGFHILRVSKEHADFAHHSYGELDQEKEAFPLMVRLYEIDKRTSKR